MKNQKRVLLLFAAILVNVTNLFGQTADYYKQKTQECITNHDCDKAQIMYDSYKDLSKQTDANLEAAIKKCIDGKITTVVQPVQTVVETYIEINPYMLTFREKGGDEKTIIVTANVPWIFSYKPDWVKAIIALDSTAIKISCEPNLIQEVRKDSIIIKGGYKEKTIYIEQSPAIEQLIAKQRIESHSDFILDKTNVKKEKSVRVHLQYSGSLTSPLGGTFGISKNRMGGYISIRGCIIDQMNYTDISDSKAYADFNAPEHLHISFTGGFLYGIFNNKFWLYTGAGCGFFDTIYPLRGYQYDYKYYSNNPNGFKINTFEAEVGAKIVLIRHLTLSVGYNAIFSNRAGGEIQFGIGWIF